MDVGSSSQIRPPLGHPNEFSDEQHRWLDARNRHRHRRVAAAAVLQAATTGFDLA